MHQKHLYRLMQQEMTNVRKCTGHTADEVERMNEDFKRMDTCTLREELKRLAVCIRHVPG